MRISPSHLIIAFALALLLLSIVQFSSNRFIQNTLGDAIVVIFLYYALRGTMRISIFHAGVSVFTFATLLEIGQFFNLAKYLGLENHWIGTLILGNTFDFHDFIAYGAGLLWAIGMDKALQPRS